MSKRRHPRHGGRRDASASPASGLDPVRMETMTLLCQTRRPSSTLMGVLLYWCQDAAMNQGTVNVTGTSTAEQRQRAQCEQLKAKILELEGRARHLDAPVVQCQLALARSELRQISLEEAKQCWQALTGRVYEMGDKSGKLLYWLATRGAAARVVPAVRDREGNNQVEFVAIAHAFVAYYQDLYDKDPLRRLVEEGLMDETFRDQLSHLLLPWT
ncbi:hypothetical protein NDU88_004394 [Pleurodeles waltl]|uniref:Uncharacterized protein n=1 Tax=Pleurodeles waltl TaxID=8319 RepID=A0AAV7WXM2_PLEWA|nr:hypothetical protein NDU88_004394 [Pleurodeles waltl]